MATLGNMLLLRIAVLVTSIPLFLLVLSTGFFAFLLGEFWPVFLPAIFIGTSVLTVAVVVAIGMGFALALISPWAAWRTRTKSPKSAASHLQPDPTMNLPLQIDESVRISKIEWYSEALPPTLYVDDYTVMQEVSDLRLLREGDHCMVGLNLMHKLSPMVDAFVSRINSWEAAPLRVFHHFIVLDSVEKISAEGPLRADGEPVRLAEFSETLPGAFARVFADGCHPIRLLANVLALLASPARYHLAPLADYLPPSRRHGSRGNGILLVQQQLSAEQRKQVCDAAVALQHAPEMPAYGAMTANCEHACFLVSSRRWVSPQVAHLLWCLVRLLFQCVGVACLAGLAATPISVPPAMWHGLLAALYHLFSTFIVMAAVQVQLVRTAINLTQRRQTIGQVAYYYLMVKETLRAVIAGGLSVCTLAMMPRLVWDTRRLRLACLLSLTVYGLTSCIFNVSNQIVVRSLLRLGVGVPVPVFQDLREQDLAAVPCSGDSSPARGGPTNTKPTAAGLPTRPNGLLLPIRAAGAKAGRQKFKKK